MGDKKVLGDGHGESSSSEVSAGTTGDTPVSMTQFSHAFNQLVQMQQETVQNVHRMQVQLQDMFSGPTQALGGTVHQASQASPSVPTELARSLHTHGALVTVVLHLFDCTLCVDVDDCDAPLFACVTEEIDRWSVLSLYTSPLSVCLP
jgi:hypothetical protein